MTRVRHLVVLMLTGAWSVAGCGAGAAAIPSGPPRPDAQVERRAGTAMVLVPAGEFVMGSAPEEVARARVDCGRGASERSCADWFDRELPGRLVHVDAFRLDRLEVSNAHFDRFVAATGHRTTAEALGSGWSWELQAGVWRWIEVKGATWRRPRADGAPAPPDHPVVQVSWFDAQAYCRWAGLRLPTEAEWEKAARGADGRRYPWGERWDPARANGDMRVQATRPVGSAPEGASPHGALDMAGNVAEWVADWFDRAAYARDLAQNPTGPEAGTYRVVRGGSWRSPPDFLRAAARDNSRPDNRIAVLGFRCAGGHAPSR